MGSHTNTNLEIKPWTAVSDFRLTNAMCCCRRYLAQWGHRIVLHFLPTYSPDTNPIERVWWHLHEEITRNHRCANIEELLDLVFDWLAAGDCFSIETSVYDTARAA